MRHNGQKEESCSSYQQNRLLKQISSTDSRSNIYKQLNLRSLSVPCARNIDDAKWAVLKHAHSFSTACLDRRSTLWLGVGTRSDKPNIRETLNVLSHPNAPR